MITTMRKTFRETLALAVDDAKQGQQVIVSRTIPVPHINPLHFFAAAEDLYSGERTFWMSPNSDETMVGAGNEWIIDTAEQSNARFTEIETEWKRFKKYTDSSNSDKGPILMGGFSFDPFKNENHLWEPYKEGRFVLPSFLGVWKKGQKPEVTIAKVILPNETVEEAEADFTERALYVKKLCRGKITAGSTPAPFEMNEHHTEEWLASITKATESIRNGELDKVVLARDITLDSETPIDVQGALKTLINEQQSSFRFIFENGSSSFIGATPERLVQIKDQHVRSACLAGTIKRGSSDKEDQLLERELLEDQKNLEEHAYVVKMIREALLNHCSDLQCPNGPGIYKTKNVQHLYTPIEGVLNNQSSLLDIVKHLHPTPALGGLPQEKAMSMIREIEPMHRGWYAAPIGWLDTEGNGEFAVAIRSSLVKENSAVLYAGCGIVKDSNPKMEYEETKMKLRPMLSALGGLKYDRT
ncbi:isochorismate synthase [Metabacillus sp. FJAT-52054]|uniref:Isochorismate synthase MenF n=1 Tax=Metabacillus sediminis TaxID=3117746 RepID=A0ABZ2NFQ9_9BACI